MSFQISALPAERFQHLFALGDQDLARQGAERRVADSKPGFPCRVSLADAEPGETLVLLPYLHQPCDGPYRASGPIFVREGAATACLEPGEVPEQLRSRSLSVRGYDAGHSMLTGDLVEGPALADHIRRLFTEARMAYVHIHFARRGCFAARADRV